MVVHLHFKSHMPESAKITFYESESWFNDLQKLTSDELMRVYNTLKSGEYEFARDAWYIPIPLAKDERCPVMVAKGYSTPDTPQKIIKFQDIAKLLQEEFQGFIDAWDFGLITESHLVEAILRILESRTIAIVE
ncbi:MAG TPA: hypothetical protein VH415_00160 [Nitrososphaeraceae archaeon]